MLTQDGRAPGRTVAGEHVADTMDAAVAALRRQQILITKIDAVKAKAEAKAKKEKKGGVSVPAKNLAIFTRQFSVMIDAGLPLVQCLDILGKQEPHKGFSAVILKTREDVESGAALADAMKKHPKTFDALYSNMIAAGEAGGILDTILKRLATYIEKSVKLKGEVKSAMIYPVAVIVIAAVVVAAILWKVIPTFAELFAGLGAQLPMPTRIVIAASNGVVSYGWIIIVLIGAAGYGLKSYYATNNGRHVIDAIMLKLPILGDILRKVAVARFCRTLSTLLVLGRADSRRPRHHRAHRRQRHHRGRHPGDPHRHRARRNHLRAAEGDQRLPVDGRADDQRRRDDRRARRHARRRSPTSTKRKSTPRWRAADADGTDHDCVPRRHRRRYRHRDVHADLRPDLEADRLRRRSGTGPRCRRRRFAASCWH